MAYRCAPWLGLNLGLLRERKLKNEDSALDHSLLLLTKVLRILLPVCSMDLSALTSFHFRQNPRLESAPVCQITPKLPNEDKYLWTV